MDKDAPLLPLRTNATPLAAATMMATRPAEVSSTRSRCRARMDRASALAAAPISSSATMACTATAPSLNTFDQNDLPVGSVTYRFTAVPSGPWPCYARVRALRRSGYGAAAVAFERAAELSPADAARSRRLAAAADVAWHGADTARVRALVEAAEQFPPPEPAVRLRLRHVRGLIELRAGVPADGLAILLPAAAEAVKTDPHLAVAMLAQAGECAFQAGDEDAALEIAALLAVLPDSGDPRDALIAGLYRSVGPEPRGEGPEPADPDLVARHELRALTELDDPDLLARAGGMPYGLGQHALARRLRVKAVARARALGAAGTLTWALRSLALDEIDYGRFAWAGVYASEGLGLALEAGQPKPGLPAPGVPGPDRRHPGA